MGVTKYPYIAWKQPVYQCDYCDFATNNKIVYLNHIKNRHKIFGATKKGKGK